MAARLVKTVSGSYKLWGSKWGGPVSVDEKTVKGLGLDGKFTWFTWSIEVTDLQRDVLLG